MATQLLDQGNKDGCDPVQTAPIEFIHRGRSLNGRAGEPHRPPCLRDTSTLPPNRGGGLLIRGAAFNPVTWLSSLVAIGGGYALASDRKLWLVVHDCPTAELTPIIAQVFNQPDRIEAVRVTIERRQNGEVA